MVGRAVLLVDDQLYSLMPRVSARRAGLYIDRRLFWFCLNKRYNLDMNKRSSWSQGYIAVRVLVGVMGVILSLVLHELFHIVMHWGYITHVNFFPTPWTAVQIDASIPPGYDLNGEEIVAYGITLLVLLITTIIIFRIKDSEDERSTGQILFPDDRDMQTLSPSELLELSELDGAEPPAGRPSRPSPRRHTTHRHS